MYTSTLGEEALKILRHLGVKTRLVEVMRPVPGTHSLAEADHRFEDTWTKLRAFGLTEYDRVVLLDADIGLRKNVDELMELELPDGDWIAASHACACNPLKLPHYPKDWIPENCAHTIMVHPSCLTSPPEIRADSPRPYSLLNSGVVVLTPSDELMNALQEYLLTSPLVPTFSFPDQDLLSAFFHGKWKPLPYIYNGLKTLRNIHTPMWRDEEVKVVHYILDKPWKARVSEGGKGENSPFAEIHHWWWDEYEELEKDIKEKDPAAWEFMDQYVSKE
ncbi:hypothetical protein FRC03_006104 [Tulasnella sp. 419]|nr:hypothetical protein FRC03_006104 [Tulasnella sp. 419]